jgi:hypothetical protein
MQTRRSLQVGQLRKHFPGLSAKEVVIALRLKQGDFWIAHALLEERVKQHQLLKQLAAESGASLANPIVFSDEESPAAVEQSSTLCSSGSTALDAGREGSAGLYPSVTLDGEDSRVDPSCAERAKTKKAKTRSKVKRKAKRGLALQRASQVSCSQY